MYKKIINHELAGFILEKQLIVNNRVGYCQKNRFSVKQNKEAN